MGRIGCNVRRAAFTAVAAASGLGALAVAGSLAPATAQPSSPSPAPAPACRDGQSRWLHVRNLSRQALYFFRTRPAFTYDRWSDDHLGSTAVLSGSTIAVLMPSAGCACSADVQVTFDGPNGRSFEYRNISYCAASNGNRPLLTVGG